MSDAARPEPPAWRREITTISFDMDGTLVDFDAAMRGALAWVLGEIRRVVPETPDWLTVPALIALREDVRAEHPEERHSAVRHMAFARALDLVGHPDPHLVDHLAEGYLERRSAATYLYPDTVAALEALGRRYTLGVITNGNSDPGATAWATTCPSSSFPRSTARRQAGPAALALALREAGCSPHECLHVGDLPAADVAGARAAGLRSAWLRRGEAPPVAEPEPDLTIDHLTELVDLLGPGR